MDQIRILSLDGGGSLAGIAGRGARPAVWRADAGPRNHPAIRCRRGNSGGSIVLTALCCNYTPQDIVRVYADPDTRPADVQPAVVGRRSSGYCRCGCCFLPYSSTGKFKALKDLFDRNGQSGRAGALVIRLPIGRNTSRHDVNLLVTAYDYDRERAAFFRSNDQSPAQSSGAARQRDAGRSGSRVHQRADLRFDEPAEVRGRRYWDGGLAGYNNPVLAAVVEAMTNFPGDRRHARAEHRHRRDHAGVDDRRRRAAARRAARQHVRVAAPSRRRAPRSSPIRRAPPRFTPTSRSDSRCRSLGLRLPTATCPHLPVRAADLGPCHGRMESAERPDERGIPPTSSSCRRTR